MIINRYFLLLIVFLLVSCESIPVTKTKDYKEIAKTHKTIAVLPPKVNIEIKNTKEVETVRKQEKVESHSFQTALAKYINEKNERGYFSISAQQPDITNQILADNGITSFANISYQDLAKILNVDAVISSRVSLAKPLTNSEAFFTTLLTGFIADSKVNTIDLSITDTESGKSYWNFNWVMGGTFVSQEKLTASLMRSATNTFPYRIKTKSKN